MINDAIKKPAHEDAPLPAGLKIDEKKLEEEQAKLDEAAAEAQAAEEAALRAEQEAQMKAAEAKAEENAEVDAPKEEASGEITLDKDIFGAEVRSDLMHRMVNYQLAKRRSGNHKA